MRSRWPFLVALGLAQVFSAGCASTNRRDANLAFTPQGRARLLDGLGKHHRLASTSSREAQKYFDQALTLTFAFNHDEAIRSYAEAARLDPGFALAWWGVALCNGPHINNPVMPTQRRQAAWDAIQKAMSRRSGATPVEQALVEALQTRYSADVSAERNPLDRAYAQAMQGVQERYPADDDVETLCVEALMDLQPWDLWTHDGQSKGNAGEIVRMLEEVLARSPEHVGANHLYIHAVEASPHAEKAVAAADRLRVLVPGSGHLVHMPAHIDIRMGQWAKAADQNVQAIAADRRYRALSPRQGLYRMYMAHNHHFLAFASMMEGRSVAAERAARDMVAGVPAEFIAQNAALVDGYAAIVTEVLTRFGRWDDILKEPAPPETMPIAAAMWRFARATARAATRDLEGARQEQSAFRAAVERVPTSAMMSINPARKVLSIADNVLAGEIAYREGDIDQAVERLRKAVEIEDSLLYMEPPDWALPARHSLGAVLVSADRMTAAERVYRDDLRIWPENGWSLYGLAQCLRSRGASDEAGEVERRFRKSWSRADFKVTSSCQCVAVAD